GIPPDRVYSRSALVNIERLALLEAVSVMRKRGIEAVDLPGYRVKSMITLFSLFPPYILSWMLAGTMRKARGGKPPSLYQDLTARKPNSEVTYINGKIAEEAEKFNIPAPTNRVLSDVLENIAKGRIPWERYKGKPEMLIKKWKQERHRKKSKKSRYRED
ncbi:MAG: hypothetical protein J7M18_01340, partial [Candidatus Eremiobacteraeota bacterium]|nr:hypothetical protein [Candidatus Eremiobacteraeota bacterium]